MSLQQAVAAMGDSHTQVYWQQFVDTAAVYPVRFHWFRDGIYAVSTSESNRPLLGKMIRSINGHSVETVIDSIKTLITPENISLIKKSTPGYLAYSRLLQFFGFADNGEVTVVASDPDGNNSVSHVLVFRKPGEQILLVDRRASSFVMRNSNLTFTDSLFKNEGIYYIQYNKCWSIELEERYYNGQNKGLYPSFLDFRNRIIQTIAGNQIRKLVIDLRLNSGGSSAQGSSLIEALSKMKELDSIHVYVLIGRYTYSSSVINALDCRKFALVTFVGEPASGKPNHYGDVRTFKLPESGMDIYYSTKYFRLTESDENALYPDVTIQSAFSDYQQGLDPVFEWVRRQ